MEITIFCGGSGSVQLQKGLKSLYPDAHINCIINMYDDGKSTGFVRDVCNCLGPSDLRKNHYIQYLTNSNEYDQNILDFYEKRFDIPKENSEEFVNTKLVDWNMEQFIPYSRVFFSLLERNYELNDFSIANIIYGGMIYSFNTYGENRTNVYFKKFLKLEDDIYINSYENLILQGITETSILEDEGSIVSFNNTSEKIKDIQFYNKDTNKIQSEYFELNHEIEEVIDKTDLLIFSSGTQWSSLIPTYKNKQIRNLISKYEGKKIFVVNSNEDKDMINVNSKELIEQVSQYIDLTNTTFLFNDDGIENMKIPVENSVFYSMENNNGKHNPEKLASAIYRIYFGLDKDIDIIFSDFDDTIISRKSKGSFKSFINISLFNKLAKKIKFVITSGNSFEHIKNEIQYYIGNNTNDFDIWADGGQIKYTLDSIRPKGINSQYIFYKDKILTILDEFDILDKVTTRGYKDLVTCINIKPLSDLERKLFSNKLNEIFIERNFPYVARITGTTSIDILHYNASKKHIPSNYFFKKSLYIGDECDSGNDKEISKLCDKYINVKNTEETTLILKILLEDI